MMREEEIYITKTLFKNSNFLYKLYSSEKWLYRIQSNIYSDPEFLYRVKDPTQLVNLSNPPIPDLTQLNYSSDRNSNMNFLKIHCSYVENSGSISSGSYVVRLVVGAKSSSFDMSTVNTTNWLSIKSDAPSASKLLDL